MEFPPSTCNPGMPCSIAAPSVSIGVMLFRESEPRRSFCITWIAMALMPNGSSINSRQIGGSSKGFRIFTSSMIPQCLFAGRL